MASLAPAAERDEYVPVLYSQTQSLLGSPLGFDLLAQPLRRSVLERALSPKALHMQYQRTTLVTWSFQ